MFTGEPSPLSRGAPAPACPAVGLAVKPVRRAVLRGVGLRPRATARIIESTQAESVGTATTSAAIWGSRGTSRPTDREGFPLPSGMRLAGPMCISVHASTNCVIASQIAKSVTSAMKFESAPLKSGWRDCRRMSWKACPSAISTHSNSIPITKRIERVACRRAAIAVMSRYDSELDGRRARAHFGISAAYRRRVL